MGCPYSASQISVIPSHPISSSERPVIPTSFSSTVCAIMVVNAMEICFVSQRMKPSSSSRFLASGLLSLTWHMTPLPENPVCKDIQGSVFRGCMSRTLRGCSGGPCLRRSPKTLVQALRLPGPEAVSEPGREDMDWFGGTICTTPGDALISICPFQINIRLCIRPSSCR